MRFRGEMATCIASHGMNCLDSCCVRLTRLIIRASIDPGKNSSCGSYQWKGDGACDDQNNNAGCDWDGGDCCASLNQWTWICLNEILLHGRFRMTELLLLFQVCVYAFFLRD